MMVAKFVIEVRSARDLARVRRQALAAQGLLQMRPFGSGLNGVRSAIQHLGYVQIDSIAVVHRAHHHVLHSRVPRFKPQMTIQLLRSSEIFEYWAHAAAFLPIQDFRYSLPYKEAIRSGQIHWYKNPERKLMREILARIHSDGPLKSRELEPRKSKGSGWWDWKPAKKAVEQLYMEGRLMVSDREGFQKTYDLTERVLPSALDTTVPSPEELAQYLLAQQLRASAFVSLKGLTYQRRVPGLRAAAKQLLMDKLADRELEQIRLQTGEIFVCKTGTLEHRLPSVRDRVLILSPFDNSLIQRDRLASLFGFQYQLECYLPESKRRFGYFSLPLLYRDEFVGRIDCKAHRKISVFEIKSLHVEAQVQNEAALVGALAEALRSFAEFHDCEDFQVHAVDPEWKAPLLKALQI